MKARTAVVLGGAALALYLMKREADQALAVAGKMSGLGATANPANTAVNQALLVQGANAVAAIQAMPITVPPFTAGLVPWQQSYKGR